MSKTNKTIKQMLAEFNEITDWFNDADLDIEQAVAQYKKATELADEIKARLEKIKNDIDIKVVNN